MASVKYRVIVDSSGTEKDFMTNVIAYLKGLSSSIDCLNDPDDEYTNASGQHYPTFTFTINGKSILNLTREREIAYWSNNSIGKVMDGYSVIGQSSNLVYGGNAWNDQTYRSWHISSIISDSFIVISIQSGGSGSELNSNITAFYVTDGTTNYSSEKHNLNFSLGDYDKENLFNISELAFKSMTELGSVTGTFVSRFSFKSMPGFIDYIKSSVYVTDNEKIFETTSICDCTEVTPGDTISLKDGSYYSVGPHQLIKLS